MLSQRDNSIKFLATLTFVIFHAYKLGTIFYRRDAQDQYRVKESKTSKKHYRIWYFLSFPKWEETFFNDFRSKRTLSFQRE